MVKWFHSVPCLQLDMRRGTSRSGGISAQGVGAKLGLGHKRKAIGTSHRVADLSVQAKMPRAATGSGVRYEHTVIAGARGRGAEGSGGGARPADGIEPGLLVRLGTQIDNTASVLAQDVLLTRVGMRDKGVLRLAHTQFIKLGGHGHKGGQQQRQ